MQVIYLPYDEKVENEILQAWIDKEGVVIKLRQYKLAMPMIINVTMYSMEALKVLGKAVYKWVNEFRTVRNPSEAALDRFGFRMQRIVKAAKTSDMDIVVVYDPVKSEEGLINLVRDELKRWARVK